jgi:hypothetical protein
MHLEPDDIEQLLHNELDLEVARERRSHLIMCASCRERLEQARCDETEIVAALSAMDHPSPSVDVNQLIARARALEPRSAPMRWAAGILLASVAAGAAYAAPGSPLPGWVARLSGRDAVQSPPPTAPPLTPPLAPVPTAGISVSPGARLVVRFSEPRPNGVVTVTHTEGSEVVVRAIDGVVSFTTNGDSLLVHNAGSNANFELELPRTVPRLEVVVGARRLLLQEGARLTTEAAADSAGRRRLSLGPTP